MTRRRSWNRCASCVRLPRMGDVEEGNPYAFIECVPNIYPVKGHSTPVSPGDKITYEVPDIYGGRGRTTGRSITRRA